MSTDPFKTNLGDDSDAKLLDRVLAGDRSALEEFLLRNYDWLLGYIKSKIPPAGRGILHPDDVIQEAYCRIFRNLDAFKPQGRAQLYSWLQTIARNAIFDSLRRQKRDRNVASESSVSSSGSGGGQEPESGVGPLIAEMATDQNPRASQFMQAEELHGAFHVALGDMPDEYRQVLEMLYLKGKSIEEVADALGKTVDSIRGLRMRARQQLRESMVRLSKYV